VSIPNAAPYTYAYRYPWWSGGSVIRFNNGQEVNGSKPIEAIPPFSVSAILGAYERAAQVADYSLARAERDWSNPDKQDAVKQVAAEIAEVIRYYAASAGEAGTAETTKIGSVHEHATAESGDAQGGPA
jgi:hypothetical protein